MTKNIISLFVLVLLISFGSVRAQSYSFINDSIVATFQRCDTTQEAILTITNNSNKQDTLTWKRSVRNITWPSGWTVTTCDNNGCYLSSVNQKSFYVAAHTSENITMNVTPNNIAGVGYIDLKIVNGQKDSISGFYRFNINCKSAGISNINSNSEFKIYPTPFTNSFTIESTAASKIKTVEIYNLIGSLVYKQEVNLNTETLVISPNVMMNKGLYFITAFDNNRKQLFSKRIQKD